MIFKFKGHISDGLVPEYDIGRYQNPFLVPVPSVPGFGTDTDIRYLCQAWSSYKGVKLLNTKLNNDANVYMTAPIVIKNWYQPLMKLYSDKPNNYQTISWAAEKAGVWLGTWLPNNQARRGQGVCRDT